jgi:hypothetical protein
MDDLIEQAKNNEAKVIYDMFKVTGKTDGEWDTLTLNNGGSAKAILAGNTITLTYVDGTISTYTEQ